MHMYTVCPTVCPYELHCTKLRHSVERFREVALTIYFGSTLSFGKISKLKKEVTRKKR